MHLFKRFILMFFVAAMLVSCSKHHYDFQLYFFPPGTGLKNQDWERVANIKVNHRGKNLFGREPAHRLVLVINDRAQNKFVEYDTYWSVHPVLERDGKWISETVFEMTYEMKIENDVLESETVRFTIPAMKPERVKD